MHCLASWWTKTGAPRLVLSSNLGFAYCIPRSLHTVPPCKALSRAVPRPSPPPSPARLQLISVGYLNPRLSWDKKGKGKTKINSWYCRGVRLWIFCFHFLFYCCHNTQVINWKNVWLIINSFQIPVSLISFIIQINNLQILISSALWNPINWLLCFIGWPL